jgi:hypothetical protein
MQMGLDFDSSLIRIGIISVLCRAVSTSARNS